MTRKALTCDTEVFKDYFLVMFRSADTNVVRYYEMFEGQDLDRATLRDILATFQIVTFNGNSFDVPILTLALQGASCAQLKEAANKIIDEGMAPWQFYEYYGVTPPPYLDHIDLIEVAPGQASLKLYAARLHSKTLQDLPISPDASIEPAFRPKIRTYCANDLDDTIDLYNALKQQLALRETMSAEYGMDLRSKSDAQIAEAVIRSRVSALLGEPVYKPRIAPGTTFKYRRPPFIRYQLPQLRELLARVEQATFVLSESGKPSLPPELDGASVQIGRSVYRLGNGGLHSSEKSVAHYTDDDHFLVDRDVTSYYPAIILNCELYPAHMGHVFLMVYRDIVERRVAAKRAGNKVVADSLKITINGSFGKLGSKYSALYSPHLLIAVTVTGQLALLMLIEMVHAAGAEVVSANTDGIVIKCPRTRSGNLDAAILAWERMTSFETEDTYYDALFSRDVNNYLAIKQGGGVKTKGTYAEPGLQKNPQLVICSEAVAAFLEHGTPIEETILKCRDIRKFVSVRTVRGGAVKSYGGTLPAHENKADLLVRSGFVQVKRGHWHVPGSGEVVKTEDAYKIALQKYAPTHQEYLGRVVRFYYAVNEPGEINYKSNGNKVPSSDGGKPLMELPDEFPNDVDYERYIAEARSMLQEIGAAP